MKIRPIEKDDPEAVKNVMSEHTLQFPDFIINKYPERWEAYLNSVHTRDSAYFVAADEDGTIIGHAGHIYDANQNLYEIVGVAVTKDQNRRGIGRALIQAVCANISDKGGNRVILYTLGHEGNQGTLNFYSQLGFELAEHEPDYFSPGYHRVTYKKTL